MASGSVTKVISPRTGKVSWIARVEFPPDPTTGKRSQKSKTCKTKAEAERQRTAWQSEIDGGAPVLPAKLTTGDLLTEWLRNVEGQKRVRPSTILSYRQTIEFHLVPRIGHISAQKLSPIHVERMTTEMSDEGKGLRTQQLCHLRLSQALDWGMRMGYVSRNVCKLVERPAPEKREESIWTPAQAAAFLDKCAAWRPLFELILATGMRRGEALALRWSDFDQDAGTVRVSRSLSLVRGKELVIAEPKTEKSKRTIQLDPSTASMLRAHRVAQAERQLRALEWTESGLMFTNGHGGPLFPDNVLRTFRRIITQAGVPRIRIHDLRHTHASWLLLSKEAPQVVSERLGHADPSVTLRIYAHTLRNSQDSAAAIFDAILPRKRAVREPA